MKICKLQIHSMWLKIQVKGLVLCSSFPEGRTVGEYHLQALRTVAKVLVVWDYVSSQQAELTVADVVAQK